MNVSAAYKKVVAARTKMLFSQPLWGVLSLRLKLVEDPSCPTAWTDGRSLGFNPKFVEAQTQRQLIGLVAHEVEHCTRGHCWRRGGRDHKVWNEAADRVINPDLRDAQFQLPDGALYELEPSHLGKSAEWVYERLPKGGGDNGEAPGEGGAGDQDGSAGSGQAPDGSCEPTFGEVRDPPTVGDQDGPPVTQEEWRQALVEAATSARMQGKLPASLERLVEKAERSTVDWRTVTRRWAQEIVKKDYTWAKPSVRYLPRGLYLPSMGGYEMGALAIGLDTSGSVDLVLLSQFGKEIEVLADEIQPRRIYVFSADAKVQNVEVFEPGDPIVLHPKGGGGTDFRPVFEAVAELDEPVVGVIYLTDLAGKFPDEAPDVPVLWVTGRDEMDSPEVPFGEVANAA